MGDTPTDEQGNKNGPSTRGKIVNMMGNVSKAIYNRVSKRQGSISKPDVKPLTPVTKPTALVISSPNPKDLKVKMHLAEDKRATWGISGLPEEWKQILQKSNIDRERFLRDKDDALKVVKFVAEGEKNTKIPLLTEKQLKKKMKETAQIEERDPHKIYSKIVKIGEGAGGIVFKIKRNKDEKIFAVKISDTEEIEYIRSEIAYHALSDNHPNIVNYVETFLWREEVWIVMDFVDGGALTKILGDDNPEPWTEPLIAFVLHECLNGLLFMHSQHLLHRDIKSDNVLVGRDGAVRLADFGFAVGLSIEKPAVKGAVGTPFWMAPEVIEGKEYDDRCDIWSLGVTAIELVNHEPPHMDKPHLEALLDIVSKPAPTPMGPGWSDSFREFLDRCLAKDFEKRFHAAQLLKHPFMNKQCSQKTFSEFVVRVLDIKATYETESEESSDEED